MPILSTLGAACAKAWGFTSGLVKDQYFNLVSLLLPGNGTNGKQNNAFIDSSSNAFSITPNGDVTQGTFSPFSQTGWGAYFNASNYLTATLTGGQTPGTGSVTYECWVYPTDLSATRYVFNTRPVSDTQTGILCQITSTGALQVTYSNLALFSGSANNIVVNQWQHIALVRNGSTNWTVYVNGTSIGTFSNSVNLSSDYLSIGSLWTSASFLGYISNLRIVNGVVVPPAGGPTSPLTAVSGTSILTLQSNRFKDNSTNNFTITSNGSVAITPFSPFAPTSSYSAAAVGGSGYFDGSSDYLQFTDTSNSLDLGGIQASLEFWVYSTNTSVQNFLSKGGMNSGSPWSTTDGAEYAFAYNSGILYFTVNNAGGTLDLTGNFTVNQWNHVAIATNTSNAISMYINGNRVDTDTNAITKPTTRTTVRIGTFLLANWVYGYMCGIRHVTGSSAYDPTATTITVPTSPPAAVSGTSLLLNFTNAGVVDATAKNVLETEGNAQISTAQSKWGGGSIYLDGTSNTYVKGPVQIYLGSSNFTIEGWVRFNSVPGAEFDIYKLQDKGDASSFGALRLILNSGMKLKLLVSTTGSSWGISVDNLGNALSTGVWYYIAITRSTNDYKVYVNGSQAGATQTLSGSLYAGPINALGWNGVTTYSNMYFDDVRLTVGLARDVTVSPTAPFPLQ